MLIQLVQINRYMLRKKLPKYENGIGERGKKRNKKEACNYNYKMLWTARQEVLIHVVNLRFYYIIYEI